MKVALIVSPSLSVSPEHLEAVLKRSGFKSPEVLRPSDAGENRRLISTSEATIVLWDGEDPKTSEAATLSIRLGKPLHLEHFMGPKGRRKQDTKT